MFARGVSPTKKSGLSGAGGGCLDVKGVHQPSQGCQCCNWRQERKVVWMGREPGFPHRAVRGSYRRKVLIEMDTPALPEISWLSGQLGTDERMLLEGWRGECLSVKGVRLE